MGAKRLSEPCGAFHRNAAVNLLNLRLFTDGDRETELHFVDLFYTGANAALKIMEKNCVDGESESWSEAAHVLKGGAANLGAEALRVLCEEAQNAKYATSAQRNAMLQAIKEEMQYVKACLKTENILPPQWAGAQK